MDTVVLDVQDIFDLSDDQFYALCRRHSDLKFERSPTGELIIMPPTGGVSGRRNFSLTTQLGIWVNAHPELGVGFDSSTCFKLPNGADRAPDVAWVRMERWQALTPEQQEKFPPLAPDFVIELHSRTDNLTTLQAKMVEYATQGVGLGLLINPKDQQVEVYDAAVEGAVAPPQVLERPMRVDCGLVLPGFVLDLSGIW